MRNCKGNEISDGLDGFEVTASGHRHAYVIVQDCYDPIDGDGTIDVDLENALYKTRLVVPEARQ
jgi:hypothetical protein